MKVRELVEDLLQYDQDCELEFLCPEPLSLGSLYDDTEALYNPPETLREKATMVTLEFDVIADEDASR